MKGSKFEGSNPKYNSYAFAKKSNKIIIDLVNECVPFFLKREIMDYFSPWRRLRWYGEVSSFTVFRVA